MVGTQTNSTLVGRLRIRSRSSDPQAEQRHIARMLGAANLHPSGLPDSATLVVRRLSDPLPGRLRVGQFHTQVDLTWQSAVAAALAKLTASAARPTYGAVPAEANAVLFYDRSEILASLAKDWMSGTLVAQWWWRELFRGQDAVTVLFREWVDSPQYVPAALDLLARQSRAVPFVQRLPQQAAAEILESVLHAYGVAKPRMQTAEAKDHTEDREGWPRASVITDRKKPSQRMDVVPVWQDWVPEAANPGLDTMQKVLLVQAIMLRRAPATARTLVFQEKLLQWQTWLDEDNESDSHDISKAQTAPPNKEASRKPSVRNAQEQSAVVLDNISAPASPLDKASPAAQEHSAADAARLEISEQKGNNERRELRTEISESAQALTHVDVELADTPPQIDPASARYEITSDIGPVQQLSVISDQSSTGQTPEPVTMFDTEHGGVFFLLSMALYLYIYGDFTMPAEPGLELNIWDFLALMAWEFTDGTIEGDPLWEALASLAGRTKFQKPGVGFNPPDAWELPSDWLTVFTENNDSRPVLRNGRTVLEHPAGFTVMDVPVDAQQIEPQEMRLKRWVGWMARYFRARLVRSLGREDAVALLCHRRARVALTLTHVDVTFALDHHPIEIRIAGLDRDLGWIPAAGRYVTFHFE